MSRQALGKGLEALLGSVDTATSTLRNLPVEEISPNPYQPRIVFDDHDLSELSDSIRLQGVLQPVTVRSRVDGGYELIAGERRWRAARQAGLATIPALVRETEAVESLALALVENLQRRDLNAMEAAQAYQRLLSEFCLTQEQVAEKVGKDRSSVANTLRLLNLPMEVQDHIQAGRITLGHAKVLLGVSGSDRQMELARRVMLENLSVRQLEAAISHARPRSAAPRPLSEEGEFLRSQLAERLGTRVNLSEGKRGGKIEIRYTSAEERDRITSLLVDGE